MNFELRRNWSTQRVKGEQPSGKWDLISSRKFCGQQRNLENSSRIPIHRSKYRLVQKEKKKKKNALTHLMIVLPRTTHAKLQIAIRRSSNTVQITLINNSRYRLLLSSSANCSRCYVSFETMNDISATNNECRPWPSRSNARLLITMFHNDFAFRCGT